MSLKLNRRGFEHAKHLISEGHVVIDERYVWSQHQPSAAEEISSRKMVSRSMASGICAAPSWRLSRAPGNTNILK
jgi:hypothetical protein